ncbi:MAG TPA: ribosome-associated translation inhibitor RaiA [Patescibacteria group bacterium]|nr:ribosome-associated translation inhibitor RaiA [Patescibacteria group bacterium]
MPININARKFELTDAIRQYIEKKIIPLQKHLENIIEIDVEVCKNMHHKKGNIFHVRMNVQVPHKVLFAEEEQEDLYAAVDVCRDEIDSQIRKYREEFEERKRKARKSRRAFKSLLTFWK